MAAKLLVNGEAATGKTTLLSSLDATKTLVISRDSKTFSLPIPHMLSRRVLWYGIHSYLVEKSSKMERAVVIEGVTDKMEAFEH